MVETVLLIWMKQLLSFQEVMDRLGLSRFSLARFAKAGVLTPVRKNRKVLLYPAKQVEKLAEKLSWDNN